MRGYGAPATTAAVIAVAAGACGGFGSDTPAPIDAGADAADAAPDAPPDVASSVDGDVDASKPVYSVRCDKVRCADLFVCCFNACKDANTCASSSVYVCDDQEDCAARGVPLQHCCGKVEGANITGSRCATSCAGNEVRLCTQGKSPDECSAGGNSCGLGSFNQAYAFCK